MRNNVHRCKKLSMTSKSDDSASRHCDAELLVVDGAVGGHGIGARMPKDPNPIITAQNNKK